MRDAIAILQSVYKRAKRVFSDGPQEPSDEPRRTERRGPQRPSSLGSEAPSYRTMTDSRASERDNSFAAPSRHGGSRYAPSESVDHRGSPPTVVVEEEKPSPSLLADLRAEVSSHSDELAALREDVKHERERRYALQATVARHRNDRSDDRSDIVLSQLEFERSRNSLREELQSALREVESLKNQVRNLVRDHKTLVLSLERVSCLRPCKRTRTGSTDEDDRHKTKDACASYVATRSCMNCLCGAIHETVQLICVVV